MESIYEPSTNISGYHYALRYFKMTNSNLFNYEANNMNAGLRKTNGKGHLTSDLGRDFGELKSILRLKGTGALMLQPTLAMNKYVSTVESSGVVGQWVSEWVSGSVDMGMCFKNSQA